MDGDGQRLNDYLPNLLDAIIEQDYACANGDRFLASESLNV